MGVGVWASTRDGLAYVRRTPVVRALVVGLTVFVAFAALDNIALVFLVEDRLGGSPTTYGLVQGGFGIGMLVVSVALASWRRPLAPTRQLLTGGGLTVAGSLATAAAPSLALGAAAQAFAGAGNGAADLAISTMVQRLVPPDVLGRVFGAVATGGQTGIALAYVGGAPLVAVLGPRTAFVIAGLGSLVGLLVLRPALRAE